MFERGSGILLNISSLPSRFGIGDFGPQAFKFVDFLARSGQKYWQILPLNPTDSRYANSPYRSVSAFALNPLFISPQLLYEENFLKKNDILWAAKFKEQRIDYEAVIKFKKKIFNLAFERFKSKKERGFEKFCKQNSYWLNDYTIFTYLKDRFLKKQWFKWPSNVRDRNFKTLQNLKDKFKEKIEKEKFLQYIAFRQWHSLKNYCKKKGIRIIGDLPIYVEYNSSDVWAHPEIFKLDKQKKPYAVSGVPPDYFSKTGQLWNNPVYNWSELKKRQYRWWIDRFQHNFKLFDIVRIDHFRGFVGYWEIPYGSKTALSGKWVKAPAVDFFTKVSDKFRLFPIIAEDLGVITAEVRSIMQKFGFFGMKVLLFAFSGDKSNPYLAHNAIRKSVMYTGTHDNNTIQGWLKKDASPKEKENLYNYIGKKINKGKLHWEMIKMAMSSASNIVILPMQDILGLDERARMNKPATKTGNWLWRLMRYQLNPEVSRKLLNVTKTFDRI